MELQVGRSPSRGMGGRRRRVGEVRGGGGGELAPPNVVGTGKVLQRRIIFCNRSGTKRQEPGTEKYRKHNVQTPTVVRR